MKRKKMLVADLLCGAGGSSTGCQRALRKLGVEMELVCLNHWPVAIETHKLNHPEARHYVQDISTVRPHIIVPEGYLDLLMASPTCTHHSVARGGKPTSDQQRSDPWHIITWLTELRVKRLIIENVWEFTSWGPVNAKTGRPVASRRGEYFLAWIETIKRLGFEPEWRKLNAADFGGATTRTRFILMARSDRKIVHWPMPTHAKKPDVSTPLFPGLKPWRPAREIIDWSLKGRSIYARKKPLAPKTLMRIYAGAVKLNWPEPFLVVLRRHMTAQGIDAPLPTLTGGGTHVALVEPVVMNARRNAEARGVSEMPVPTLDTKGGVWVAEPMVLSAQNSGAARSAGEPVPTITTGGSGTADHPGCARPILVEPFIAGLAHGNEAGDATADSRRVRTIDDPLGAITAGGGDFSVIEPFVVSPRHGKEGAGPRPRSVEQSIPSLTASVSQIGVVEPFILNRHGDNGGARAHPIDAPAPTANCDGGGYLVEPSFLLSRQGDGAPRSVEEPTPTQVAKHSHVLITSYYGASESAQSAEEPLPTATAKCRFGIVMPVTHAGDGNRARDVEEEGLPTVTTANRGELAFIVAQHGEAPGQAPRTHSIDAPAPTIAATGHVDLVEPGVEFDILFRMLEPHELAAAMGFNRDEARYEFAGTKTEQVKQIGNAVSVEKMEACVGALCRDAAPEAEIMREAAQ